MILTYYQSVELMSFLPVLLSAVDAKTNAEIVAAHPIIENEEGSISDIYPVWNITTTGMEVNNVAFY